MTQQLTRTDSAKLATAALSFTPEQSQMIRDTYANGASESEFAMLMESAKARNLNPILRQVHFVKRWDSQKRREVWAIQVAIDGLRAVADRTALYDGQDEPENEYAPDGSLIAVRVKVYRKGIARPFVGIARWSEYVHKTKEGQPTRFWQTMPHTMLAKCAEALAIRKAFPEDTGGLHITEETHRMDNEEREPPRVTPTSEPDESEGVIVGDEDVFHAFRMRLETLDADIQACDSYDNALACAELVGTPGKQSTLTKEMQAAYENGGLNGDMRSALGKLWQRCSRQVKIKLEKLNTGPEAAFADPADPENDGR